MSTMNTAITRYNQICTNGVVNSSTGQFTQICNATTTQLEPMVEAPMDNNRDFGIAVAMVFLAAFFLLYATRRKK